MMNGWVVDLRNVVMGGGEGKVGSGKLMRGAGSGGEVNDVLWVNIMGSEVSGWRALQMRWVRERRYEIISRREGPGAPDMMRAMSRV